VDLIDYANSLNIDFIICDHHEPGGKIPNCLVLDPKREDCNYPYKELCGCGVGFKLLQGLTIENKWKLEPLYELLDFVAVSIGADIVPITGENRILCFHGMRLLNAQPRASFKTLLTLAKRSFPVTLTDVVFTIAPRINAAGRIHTGKFAVDLMTSQNASEIKNFANEINEYNTERRALDTFITTEALEMIEADECYAPRKSTVVFKEDWHKGVVGIVASRLIEQHFKPTIVLTENNGMLTGSARTVNDFNIYKAIDACSELLEQFGGHSHAAGLTLKKENIDLFIAKFEEVVQKTITQEDLAPEQIIDLELDFNTIFTRNENRMQLPKFKRILNKMEPHGPGNMKPVFITRNVFSTDVKVLKEQHLKLKITQPNSDVILDGIAFNLGYKEDEVAAGMPFDVVYTLESNSWNGSETVQLNIKDIRSSI
jgi:single-stranded-DNA-specific exonuclease